MSWLFYLWPAVLLLGNLAAWCLNLLGLPGNWLIVLFSALFAWLVRGPDGLPAMSGYVVVVLLLLALAGELVEFLAGMAGAARQRASRRSLALSLVGSIVGSLAGVAVGLPVPVVGSAVAAVVGGALGAFLGAAIGEHWKGTDPQRTLAVGSAAFWGRLWGTAGKLAVGAVMVIVATVDAFG
jgi:uncharacterized protein YqgC (DUF456 family)